MAAPCCTPVVAMAVPHIASRVRALCPPAEALEAFLADTPPGCSRSAAPAFLETFPAKELQRAEAAAFGPRATQAGKGCYGNLRSRSCLADLGRQRSLQRNIPRSSVKATVSERSAASQHCWQPERLDDTSAPQQRALSSAPRQIASLQDGCELESRPGKGRLGSEHAPTTRGLTNCCTEGRLSSLILKALLCLGCFGRSHCAGSSSSDAFWVSRWSFQNFLGRFQRSTANGERFGSVNGRLRCLSIACVSLSLLCPTCTYMPDRAATVRLPGATSPESTEDTSGGAFEDPELEVLGSCLALQLKQLES